LVFAVEDDMTGFVDGLARQFHHFGLGEIVVEGLLSKCGD
jgi:hypothetical protein